MSDFKVEVVRLDGIEPIVGADAIELARISDYLSVVRKGQFAEGDLVAYLPEASLLPNTLLEDLNLVGKLSGSGKNRVKAAKFRGQLSQGICYPARPDWVEGQDVAEELGVVKWVQEVPTHLRGNYTGDPNPVRYDFENIKKYPRMFEDGEQVVMTEKIHGTFVCFGLRRHPDGTVQRIVCSKGLGAKGFFFKLDDEANANNVYVRTAQQLDIFNRLDDRIKDECTEILLFGEIYGVQDLKYDYAPGATNFRAFDLKLNGEFVNLDTLEDCCRVLRVPMVPILYEGPFSKEVLLEHTVGKETLSGRGLHVREGVVVKPVIERLNPKLPHGGRVCGKSINPAYLLRGGDTSELE